MLDIVIIGNGPAGLSAAITARQRGKTATIIANDRTQSGLYRASEVDNYPGLPKISGADLSDKLTEHALAMGAELIAGRVSTILPMGGSFGVGYGTQILSAKCVILATGVAQTATFPGEAELLGRGVSYCATCDGMLFRGRRVCVVCLSPEAESEADYLESIGCDVVRVMTNKVTVNGGDTLKSITADGEEILCDGVFILRRTIAPNAMLPGLELAGGHIKVDAAMRTSIPGAFAAGDCIGKPYQIAKATGEGLIAALSAAEYIAELDKG